MSGTHHHGIVNGLYSRWLLQSCYLPAWFWGAPWTTWYRPRQASWIHPLTVNHYANSAKACVEMLKNPMCYLRVVGACITQARARLEDYSVSTSPGTSPAETAGQVSGSPVLLSYQQQKGESLLWAFYQDYFTCHPTHGVLHSPVCCMLDRTLVCALQTPDYSLGLRMVY